MQFYVIKMFALVMVLFAAICNLRAQATTYTVTSTEDTEEMMDEECNTQSGELRYGIENTTADTIVFNLGSGTHDIGLSEFCGTLFINRNLTIVGPGASVLTIGGEDFSVFEIADNVTVTISDVTVTGSLAEGGDGAMFYNKGTLTLEDCELYGGFADSGGAIFNNGDGANDGQLELVDCTIAGCHAIDGGGINNYQGDVVLDGTTIEDCNVDASGGGINTEGGSASVLLKANSEITGCFATATGGGVVIFSGTLTVDNSTICSNDATEETDGGDLYVSGGSYSITNGGSICEIDP